MDGTGPSRQRTGTGGGTSGSGSGSGSTGAGRGGSTAAHIGALPDACLGRLFELTGSPNDAGKQKTYSWLLELTKHAWREVDSCSLRAGLLAAPPAPRQRGCGKPMPCWRS